MFSTRLLLPDCIRFSCCSSIASASAAACCLLLASASAAAPRLRPLQLLLATCVRFSCYSPIASASTAPHLRPLQLLLPDCIPAVLEDSSPCPCPMFSNILCRVRGSVNIEVRRLCVTSIINFDGGASAAHAAEAPPSKLTMWCFY